MEKHEERTVLPRLYRFHSFVKPDEEDKIEKEIVQNCHILINLTPRRRANSVFRSPERPERDYSVSQFQEKLKLFERRRMQEFTVDPSHKFF